MRQRTANGIRWAIAFSMPILFLLYMWWSR